uniref:Uncharacterized protein n=1 Tax=Peronospora matthiolae TaxID=2874970 RepID=A0AAV1ULS5_9STRA
MKTEFVAASEIAREKLGMRWMIMEMELSQALPMQMHFNNQAAISQTAGEASLMKAKHVEVRHNFLCDFA